MADRDTNLFDTSRAGEESVGQVGQSDLRCRSARGRSSNIFHAERCGRRRGHLFRPTHFRPGESRRVDRDSPKPPIPPTLKVIKSEKGPMITTIGEFSKVGPGPSSSQATGPMRITNDFYGGASVSMPHDMRASLGSALS